MKTRIWYSVQNGGDGSAYPKLFESEELAELDQTYMDEGWGEPCVGYIEIEHDGAIKILDAVATVESEIKEVEDNLNEDYMKEYKSQGKYPHWFERLEGRLKALNSLLSKD